MERKEERKNLEKGEVWKMAGRDAQPCVCTSNQGQVKSIRNIGVIGSRSLPLSYADKVGQVTEDLIDRGFHIASGGALGTDQFCLDRLISTGNSHKCSIFSAWENFAGFSVTIRHYVREAQKNGASIMWGFVSNQAPLHLIKIALLKRNERLVEACYGVTAFLMPNSKGTLFTISKAVKAHLPLVVFPVNAQGFEPNLSFNPVILPQFTNVKWVQLRCGGCWEGGFKAVYLR